MWIQTITGRKFDFDHVEGSEVDIEDVAHSLSHQCRFMGHSRVFYSIAEHCIRIWKQLREEGYPLSIQKWGLLHDAAEAYTSDIPRPLKHWIRHYCPAFDLLEERVERHVWDSFGLTGDLPLEVKIADARMLLTEKRDLLAEAPQPWEFEQVSDPKLTPYPHVRIHPVMPPTIKAEFLLAYQTILNEEKGG